MTSGFVPELKIWSLHFNGTQVAGEGKCLTIGLLFGLLWIRWMIGDVHRVLALPRVCDALCQRVLYSLQRIRGLLCAKFTYS